MGVAIERDLAQAEASSTEAHQLDQEQTGYWEQRCFAKVVIPQMDMGSDSNYYELVVDRLGSSLR